MKRKLLSFALVLVLLCCLCVPVWAADVQYKTTKSFLEVLDAEDCEYKFIGVDQGDYEELTVEFEGDYLDSITADIFFNADGDVVSMRVWDLITIDEKDYADVMKAINDLHRQYKFVCFAVDTDDWTVYATLDAPLRECDEAGDIAADAVYYLVNIADRGYQALKDFAV